jgi:hypothetical protein
VPQDPVAEHRALFVRDGERFVPTPLARGPWDPSALHGGAPAALFAWAIERHDPGDASFLARLTVELLRPVPLAPLELRVRTSRPGRKVQWLEAALWSGATEAARASALRLHSQPVEPGDHASPDVPPPPGVEAPAALPFADTVNFDRVGYWNANEVRLVAGTWGAPGPGAAWFRLRCPVVEGEAVSGPQRVAAAADFGSGIGNPVEFARASAINPDLSIHLHRHPAGPWVALESTAWAHRHGTGMAETRLWDEDGPIGRAVQTLLVQPQPFVPPVRRPPMPAPRTSPPG